MIETRPLAIQESGMDRVFGDLRSALRMIGRERGFAAVVIFTLAIAIGGNTAVFSVVDGVLLKPLPYPEADRLVSIFHTHPSVPMFPITPGDFYDFRERNRTFEEIAVFNRSEHEYGGANGPENLQGLLVSRGFFEALGSVPFLGRTFNAEDEKPGRPESVILSYRFWRDRLGSDPHIVGRTIRLSRRPFLVIGVMTPGLQHVGGNYRSLPHGDTAEFWTPFTFDPARLSRFSHYLNAIGRVRPGVNIEQARADLNRIAAVLEGEYPRSNRQWRAVVSPLRDELVGASQPLLLVALGAVALVLLIACGNLACMLLARGMAKSREYALRMAVGADREHVLRQVITEALVLSFGGAVLGVPLAVLGVRVLLAIAPESLPRRHMIEVDAGMLLFAALITPLAALLFGFLPAFRSSRTDPERVLRESGRALTGSRSGLRTYEILVGAEVALCLIVLAGAGLLARTFFNLKAVPPGFQPDHVLTASIDIPAGVYGTPEKARAFYAGYLVSLRSEPSVVSAGIGSALPFSGYDENSSFEIEGRASEPDKSPGGRYHQVSPGYFEALGIPVKDGRAFRDSDNAESEPVVLINEALAKRYFHAERPIGRFLSIWGTRRRIVGIVGDVKDMPAHLAAAPAFYRPFAQQTSWRVQAVVRVQGDPAAAEQLLRRSVSLQDPNVPLFEVKTLSTITSAAIALQRFAFILFAAFAGVALLLATIGVYGVMSYAATRRMQEFGVRIALGARSADVLKLVLTRTTAIALTGIACGIAGAFAFTRLIESYLYGVTATDPVNLAAVACLLLALLLLAALLPARRAARTNPASLLRAE
jgi:predicted permease